MKIRVTNYDGQPNLIKELEFEATLDEVDGILRPSSPPSDVKKLVVKLLERVAGKDKDAQ